MVACVTGEQHDFPARLLTDALDLAGYEVRFLGADVPEDDLASALRATPPDVLALSITMPFNAGGLRRCVARAREVAPRLPIAVGGHACEWSAELAREVGAQLTARNARDFLAQVDAMLGINGMPS
jgi:methanogenic corrinoid protein MtbC1